MNRAGHISFAARSIGIFAVIALGFALSASESKTIRVDGSNLSLASNSAIRDGPNLISLALDGPTGTIPFTQAAVKASTAPARFGPHPDKPHFAVRFALPIPPDNATNVPSTLTGLDENVWPHNHSPGFETLPNGDLLAIYFSAKTSAGANESDNTTRFVQARLRHGAEQWDPPELFLNFEEMNDQSALLWTEGNTIRFFGGGRGASHLMPFKMATSTNNGATWRLSLPQLDQSASDYTAQPVVNAFRGGDGAMYFAMDAHKDNSFLWRSDDDGIHWHDTGGRTGARHSTIIPLDDSGKLFSLGGKNSGLNGWTPMNMSTDWGKTWSQSERSPFPALGGNQRPCLIRLANGHLWFVTDSYHRNTKKSPEGWRLGEGCFVAVSKDNGASWHFKQLPVALRHEKDRALGTLGYATVRQAPNGVIHLLATMTHPGLHYEFNEAWVFSEAGDIAPETGGGKIVKFREDYPHGSPRVTWSARVCPNGRYLLDGKETSYHPNGKKEHEVIYASGHKTGTETFWAADGTKLWSWNHNLKQSTSTWTHYWPNGRSKVQSRWITKEQARDSERIFSGLVAHGPASQWNENGKLIQKVLFDNGTLGTGGQKGVSKHDAH